MASTTIPPDLKPITPYLARATELAKAEPAIGYWCTYYALQQAIAIQAKSPESTTYLLDLMDKLEAMKGELSDLEAVTDEAIASAHVENFALKIFGQADREDRAGKATRLTAKKFLAAANFLELLSIFGEINSDRRDQIKYAKWKAADIAKAFREGRTPVPGPAGGLPEESEFTSVATAAVNGDGEPLAPEQVAGEQISGAEASELAKELAAMSAADEAAEKELSSGGLGGQGEEGAPASEPASEVESYPFPQQPTSFLPSAPSDGTSSLPNLPSAPIDEDDEHPATPAFPSFLNTPLKTPGAETPPSEGALGGHSGGSGGTETPPALPQTHQTMNLLPPPTGGTATSGFPAAVFPTVPSVLPPPPPAPPAAAAAPTTLPTSASIPTPPALRPPPVPPAPRTYATPSAPPAAPPAPPPMAPLDPMKIATVQKHAKWAISALNYEDVETAKKELKAALLLLG